MSTRSRAHPWFAVSVEQRLAWATPGGFVCEHGTFIDPTPWSSSACLLCDMVTATGTRHGPPATSAFPIPETTREWLGRTRQDFLAARRSERGCEAVNFQSLLPCGAPPAPLSRYCPAHYRLEYEAMVEDHRYVVKVESIDEAAVEAAKREMEQHSFEVLKDISYEVESWPESEDKGKCFVVGFIARLVYETRDREGRIRYEYQDSESNSSPAPTEDRSKGEWHLRGSVKWDGCCNYEYNQSVMIHICGPADAEEQAELFRHVYRIAHRMMPWTTAFSPPEVKMVVH